MLVDSSTLFLVSCVSKKGVQPAAARDLYASPWFRLARSYVERHRAEWFILSAEYGLLEPDRVVAPYNRTLNAMAAAERRAWAQRVMQSIRVLDQHWERIVLLAGLRYREFLVDELCDVATVVEAPLARLGIGQQMRWLKEGATR